MNGDVIGIEIGKRYRHFAKFVECTCAKSMRILLQLRDRKNMTNCRTNVAQSRS